MKVTRNNVWLGLSGLIALAGALGAWHWLNGLESAPPAAGERAGQAWVDAGLADADPASESGRDESAAAGVVAAQPESWPPLPPLETPLADIIDELSERARAGDPDAACRLAAELLRCSVAKRSAGFAEDMEHQLARQDSTPDAMLQTIARAQTDAERYGSTCEGIDEATLASTFDWQRQSAVLSPERRLAFALYPALNRRDFLSDYERWGEYRRLALPWLEAAARDGDPAAIVVLARIYGDHRQSAFPAPPFRIRDDEKFVLYAELMDRLGLAIDAVQTAAASARERLSAQAQTRLAAQVEDMASRLSGPLEPDAAERVIQNSLRAANRPEHCAPPQVQ